MVFGYSFGYLQTGLNHPVVVHQLLLVLFAPLAFDQWLKFHLFQWAGVQELLIVGIQPRGDPGSAAADEDSIEHDGWRNAVVYTAGYPTPVEEMLRTSRGSFHFQRFDLPTRVLDFDLGTQQGIRQQPVLAGVVACNDAINIFWSVPQIMMGVVVPNAGSIQPVLLDALAVGFCCVQLGPSPELKTVPEGHLLAAGTWKRKVVSQETHTAFVPDIADEERRFPIAPVIQQPVGVLGIPAPFWKEKIPMDKMLRILDIRVVSVPLNFSHLYFRVHVDFVRVRFLTDCW